jgi:predicted nucleotidyltransferase component of viral defense system
MDKFIALPEEERRTAFQEAANKQGILPIIIEKDFWVCWTLRQIFGNEQLAQHITFKGDTSLSKAYRLIERFSEDIDLTISKDAPYLVEGHDAMEADISGKERQRRIDALKENARRFVSELALPVLQKALVGKLSGDWRLVLDRDDPDKQTILFYYPALHSYTVPRGGIGGGGLSSPGGLSKPGGLSSGKGTSQTWEVPGYIKPAVRLEFGARGDIEPSENKQITPYVAESFQQLFGDPHSNVHVLAAERTFWEKATILHALHHGTKMRDRMSRHYYDTFIMAQKGIADAALRDVTLLEKVVRNKSLMFQDSKASYDTAVIGSLRLVPKDAMLPELRRDYAAMQEMFIGEVPEFETIMSELAKLEERISS